MSRARASSASSSIRSAPERERSHPSARETGSACSGRSATATTWTSGSPFSSAAESASRRCPISRAVSAGLRLCSDSARAWHAEAACLVPNAEVVIDPVLVTEALAGLGDADLLACGPEPMLRAVAQLSPRAQLAWEAPMACGYGACFGCVVEIDGRLRRLCVDGPVLRHAPGRCQGGGMILNASGCLDALLAPDTARLLDAFVTKTVTPLPRDGNPPIRIAETDVGMLNTIGLANPGIEAFCRDTLPSLASPRDPALGVGRRLLGRRVRACLQPPRCRAGGRDDRAQPLLPERSGTCPERLRDHRGRPLRQPRSRSTPSSPQRFRTFRRWRRPQRPPEWTASRS